MKRLTGIFLLCLLVVSHNSAHAASLYLDPGTISVSRGDAVKVAVRVDTDEEAGECINAAEGVLTFSGPIEPVDVSIGNSIFSVWVEQPTLSDDRTMVTFAGGVPNGYCGRVAGDPRLTNNLFDIIVRTDTDVDVDGLLVEASVNFTDQTLLYLNDGLGTTVIPEKFPSIFSVSPDMNSQVTDPWTEEILADTSSPQPFAIQLSKDDLAFRGRYIISFNTTDKQTGIDRYEVMEEPLAQFDAFTWGRIDAPWIETRSPYVLEDQTLNSIIRVKAIDKAGNEHITTFVPDESLRTVSLTQFLTYLLVASFVLVMVLGGWYLGRRSRIKKQAAAVAMLEQSYNSNQYEN